MAVIRQFPLREEPGPGLDWRTWDPPKLGAMTDINNGLANIKKGLSELRDAHGIGLNDPILAENIATTVEVISREIEQYE